MELVEGLGLGRSGNDAVKAVESAIEQGRPAVEAALRDARPALEASLRAAGPALAGIVAAGLPALQEVARAVVITEITPPGPYDFLAGCTPSPQEMTWRPWAS